MGTSCMPSKQSINKTYTGEQNVTQKSRSKQSNQPSRLSGVFDQDESFFKQRIDKANGRKRLNLANAQIIDSDLTQMMKYRWVDEIQELNLENNYITSEGYRLLMSRQWPNLIVLNLSVNKVQQVEGLGQFPRLEIGYFQRNPLSASSKRFLADNNFKNGIFLCWNDNE